MPSLPSPQQVAGRHLPLFEAYYKELDPNNSNNIGALAAAKFLKNSGLPDALLSKIWDLSDPNATGSLTKSGLFVALKLVALAQNNVDVSMANIGRDVPPPMMGDATVFPPNIPVAPSPLTIGGGARAPVVGGNEPLIPGIGGPPTVDWSMTPMEKLKYETLFESLQPQNGFIPGNKVKGVLMDSKLPTDTLGRIWDLADMDRDGCLDRHEFRVAMHLVYKALEKCAIPATLPPELLPPAKRELSNRMTPPLPPPPAAPWVVSQEEQGRYEAMFLQADKDQDGYVNGPEIKHVFLSCNLPQPVLANIWSLADMKQVGKLNKEQFCLALWLVQQVLKGNELPPSLTAEMVPPSMRGGGAPGGVIAPVVNAPAQPPPPPSNPEMDMISKDIAELSAERSALETEVEVKAADITIRSGEIKSLQGELDALIATLRQLENQKIEAAKRLGDLKLQTGDINSELAEVESEIAVEQAQVDKLRTTATDQETLLSRQESELTAKKQELEVVKQEEHLLEKKQKELSRKVSGLTTSQADAQLVINQIQNKVSALETLQRDMRSLIALAEEVEAKTSGIESVPESLLSLEPEFKQEDYARLVQKEKSPPNGFATDAFPPTNGFASDPFTSTAPTSQNDPFAAAFDSNGHDPFADSASGDAAPADTRFTKDPFGCDPFSAAPSAPTAATGGTGTLSVSHHGHPPPPRPESPSPALPPKKSKQPPPRPAPPRPSAPTQPLASSGPGAAPPSSSGGDGFADFDNFNSKAASTVVSSPFSSSSVYSSAGSLSPPHPSVKPPGVTSPPPPHSSSSTAIGRPHSRASLSSRVSSRTTTPGHASSFANTSASMSGNSSASYPPLSDFTDDPFKDYRYEDPFNIVDPFSDDDRPASTLPARTKPDGSPAPFDPFLEGRPASTRTVGGDDMFANDPFFASTSAAHASGQDSSRLKDAFSDFASTSSFGDFSDNTKTFEDPFFSPSSANGVASPPTKSNDPFKSSTSNGFGDPFSFSTPSSSGGNKFADDNFDSMFTGLNANGKSPPSKAFADGPSTSKGFAADLSTSSVPLTSSSGSLATKSNGIPQGSLRGPSLPSEDEQLAWAAAESLKLETEKKLKERQERADLELAMKLSQNGESFPVQW